MPIRSRSFACLLVLLLVGSCTGEPTGLDESLNVSFAVVEGDGNETYMTSYRWNGDNFVHHKTVNVVRNLRSFLAEVF